MGPQIVLQEVTKVFHPDGGAQELFSEGQRELDRPGAKIAVAGVSLRIGHGERLGIVGRNGAGKSTLLHMIAGLLSPTSGSMRIDGKVTSVMTLGVGLREQLTGRENIYIDGELQGHARAEVAQIIDQIIDFAELGDFIDYPVRTYSTGMKARLAFSMISHIDPEILIIDETLSVGDAAFAVKATRRIEEICARGKIVILVSHSMDAIRTICNRCLWMEEGRVVMDGSPEDVTKAYIDAVRAEDEAELLVKFQQIIGNRSHQKGWSLDDLVIYNGPMREPRTLLEAGQPTHIAFRASLPLDANDASVRIRIIRLDGLLMFDEILQLDRFERDGESIHLKVEMMPLVLGAAVYRLDISTEHLGRTLAESSSIFEVYTLNAPTGGKPALLYPVTVTVNTAD